MGEIWKWGCNHSRTGHPAISISLANQPRQAARRHSSIIYSIPSINRQSIHQQQQSSTLPRSTSTPLRLLTRSISQQHSFALLALHQVSSRDAWRASLLASPCSSCLLRHTTWLGHPRPGSTWPTPTLRTRCASTPSLKGSGSWEGVLSGASCQRNSANRWSRAGAAGEKEEGENRSGKTQSRYETGKKA